MGFASAVDWWEVSQLRILVLGSLGIQWLLFLSASLRKLAIPYWIRCIIWLAYLGSDAVAVYGLATLFNRQRKQNYSSENSSSILEVVWAPVLLMHLGGQDCITAYNIEDNELWARHVLTSVSQITVAVYVFCKSWPGGDKRLLQASILLFVPGILKCIEKPWALKNASFNSLVSLTGPYQRISRSDSLHPGAAGREARRAARNTARRIGRLLPGRGSEASERPASLHPGMVSREASKASEVAHPSMMVSRIAKAIPLEDYVQKARALILDKCYPQATGEATTIGLEPNHVPQAQGETNEVDLEGTHHRQGQAEDAAIGLEPNHVCQAQGVADAVDLEANHHRQSHEEGHADDLKPNHAPKITLLRRLLSKLTVVSSQHEAALLSKQREKIRLDLEAHKLFVDLASPYPDRLSILEAFPVHDKNAYSLLQEVIFETFDLLYTKTKMLALFKGTPRKNMRKRDRFSGYIRGAAVYLPFAAVGLFHNSHREVYDVRDVKVTYALFCCTAVLEGYSMYPVILELKKYAVILKLKSSGTVAQYSLLGFFVRNKRHTKKMSILNFFNCKDFLDQRWCMDSCSSSSAITKLVFEHVKGWWKEHIVDAASYRNFNDHRGQWTIQRTGRNQDLGWSLNRPFDESVLLWHIATDFCLFQQGNSSVSLQKAMRCREISNYLMYLLFVNPEMLLSGTRRNLFMIANAELEEILKDDKPFLQKILKGDKPSSEEIESGFMQQIIAK